MRVFAVLSLATALWFVTGCHSAYVEATVVNETTQPIPLIEVDYPSASFGTENLAPGGKYHYRFKVLGSGETKVVYTDSARQEKKAKGPSLKEGDEGPMTITFAADGVRWQGPPAKH